ncbi:MAG: hypothetical protein DRR08_27300 [Candidatus Parabeggiatoa sp. nov. 2]|nr:MAG: hypothetical protein DRR08_27300 [Gammaproteobacteria bacterium]
MNVEVRWQNGALIPLYPIQFRHQVIVIIVPDEEIEQVLVETSDPLESVKDESLKQMIMKMRRIRGPKKPQKNDFHHGLTDNELFAEGLKKSGKYDL